VRPQEYVKAIEERTSVRKYEKRPVDQALVRQVVAAGNSALTLRPEIAIRWYVVWDGRVLSRALDGLAGVYGMLTSAPHYVIAVSEGKPGYMENLGFCMEQLILTATALGLGTCWIGGMFTERKLRQFAPDLGSGERIVALTPLGYPDRSTAARMARQLMRWGSESQGKRKPLSEIVSQDIWTVPWSDSLGAQGTALGRILSLTRMAPSWANTQPWHFIVDGRQVIATVDSRPQKGNLREGKSYCRLDGGIAMCHFYLASLAEHWSGEWTPIAEDAQQEDTPNIAQMRARYGIPDHYALLGTYYRRTP
jgi:nitroreductase